ncbi:MAG: PEP-CTERM sorting domain-containing protein [Bryobacterales bacterium]|nr:PEP-CTERM sorting domain-containing protein [Bryobacterales bacterium]
MNISKILGGGLAKLALALTLAIGLAGSASATIIDDFTFDQALLSTTGGTVSSEVCGGPMLGGCRDITITAAAADNGASPTSSASVLGGFLNISNDFEITSTVTVGWDGPGIPGPGLAPPANFTTSLAIVVQVFFADLGMDIEIELMDGGGNTATRSLAIASTQVPPTGPINYSFDFASFTSAPGALDLSDITSVRMIINGPAAYDARISFVDTTPIPEPGTMLLSAVALLGLGLLRRRAA